MNDQEPRARDYWDAYAECMDLTIEGHRLIAQELAYEAGMLWRAVKHGFTDLTAAAHRWRSAPPV